MNGPSTVRLQRRRGELPPDQLFVERRGGKRKVHPSVEDATRGYYIRQKRETSISGPPSSWAESAVNNTDLPTASSIEARRTFHLKQPSLLPPSAEGSKSRKRKQNEALLPTVFEKRQRKFEDDAPTHHLDDGESQAPTPSAPPKRPGRGSAVRPQAKQPAPTKPEDENVALRQQRDIQALAQEMHQFALEELAKTPKPQIKTKPKLPPSRSRALHEQQQSPASPQRNNDHANKDHDDDTAMDSDNEYVYDTYVLAPVPQPSNPNSNLVSADIPTEPTPPLPTARNIGYLIITEADESLWETYMHDLEGSDSEPTDEDDENAEDYYGADYPSDELASDDEFDRGGAAYGYRARRGSNDEQYNLNDNDDDDEDEITWSDEEDMRMMNPFAAAQKKERVGPSRVERQFAKYLDQRKRAEGEEEE